MTYLRPAPAPVGRARGPGGALRAVGDLVDDFKNFITLSSAPPATLAVQVNRFGPDAPAAYRFVDTPFPVDAVNLDPALALAALTIYQRRASDAYNQFHDQGSLAALTQANAGFADPVAFVTSHLSEVTQAVGSFADSVGLAPAAGTAAATPDSHTMLLALAAGAALWWMWKR